MSFKEELLDMTRRLDLILHPYMMLYNIKDKETIEAVKKECEGVEFVVSPFVEPGKAYLMPRKTVDEYIMIGEEKLT